MNSFGIKIREIRVEKGEPLRIVAFHLGIDQAILSKIENGKRKASRLQVEKLSKHFNIPPKELIVEWLSDKIIYDIENDEYGLDALKVAEQKVNYLRQQK